MQTCLIYQAVAVLALIYFLCAALHHDVQIKKKKREKNPNTVIIQLIRLVYSALVIPDLVHVFMSLKW